MVAGGGALCCSQQTRLTVSDQELAEPLTSSKPTRKDSKVIIHVSVYFISCLEFSTPESTCMSNTNAEQKENPRDGISIESRLLAQEKSIRAVRFAWMVAVSNTPKALEDVAQ